jgi:hypothetical protein
MDENHIRQVVVYYQEIRAQMLGDLEGYESGTHYTGEIWDGERIDTTAKTIAEVRRRIVSMDGVIGAFKALL